ncbi:MAG TPA: hypothetical protein VME19_09605 [Streptosporangiaceae bacterium]|nr:hypothetical protein [Streptosporangiaceae bacterium]
MSQPNRGLNLSDVSTVTGQERDQFSAFYQSVLGHTHRGLDYLLQEDPATLKRYRHYSNVATPNNYESERKVFVFGFLPFYAVIGYDVGVRYLIHTRQRMGLSKAQILEGIAISFLVMGPAGMETVARALDGYEWLNPESPAQFPDGWASDPAAFESGLDYSSPDMSPGELRSLLAWYERIPGEVPPHVKFLAAHRPDLLKAYRQRFETCVRELPKQIVPTTLLHYDVIRGSASGIRDNVLLARAFGVSKQIVLNTIGSASLQGVAGFDLVYDSAGDIFADWDD